MAIPAAAQTVPRLEVDVAVLTSDNPFLLPGTDRQAAQVEVTVRPGITLTMPRGSTFDLAAVITERAYSRQYGNIIIGKVDGAATIRKSEFISFGGSASFARESAIDLLTSSVEATADPNAIRTTSFARGFFQWRPDAYSTIVPEIRFGQSRFARSALLSNTRSMNAGLAYRRRLGARRTIGVRGDWITSNASRQPTMSMQHAYVTIEQQLSTGWQIRGELGLERNSSQSDAPGDIETGRAARLFPSGQLQLCHTAPDPVICLGGSLISEISGLGGLQRRAVANTSFSQRLGEHILFRVTGEYQRTKAQDMLSPQFDAIRAVAIIERVVGRRFVFAGTLQYQRRRLIDGNRIGAAYTGLRLTYKPGSR